MRESEPAPAGGITHQHANQVRGIQACYHSIRVAKQLQPDKVLALIALVKLPPPLP